MEAEERALARDWVTVVTLVGHMEETGRQLSELLVGASPAMRDLLEPRLVERRTTIDGLVEQIESRQPVSGECLRQYLAELLRATRDLGEA